MPVILDVYYDKEAKANHFSIKGVPYADKERLKNLVKGIQWQPDFKFWHCPLAIWFYNDLKWAYPDMQLGKYAQAWLESFHQRLEELLHVKQMVDASPDMFRYNWHWAFAHQRVDALFHKMVGRSYDWSDPGTGKTLKFIINAFESGCLDDGGHAIIISPNSAKYNWRNELRYAQEQIGENVPITVYGKVNSEGKRLSIIEQWVEMGGWLILNWESLRALVEIDPKRKKELGTRGLLLDRLGNRKIRFLGVDESHKGKNVDAKQTQALDELALWAERYMEGSATPITVKPDDLYAGLHRGYPNLFTTYWWFVDRFCQVTEEEVFVKGGGGATKIVKKIGDDFNPAHIDEWKTLASGLVVRRRFEEVVDIPEKQYKILPIELTPEQERLYLKASEDWLKQMDDGELVPIPNMISLITYLRQICLDPRIVGAKETRMLPAKTDALLEIIDDLGGESLVVASKFVKYIDRLEQSMKDKGLTYIRITGAESPEQRQVNKEIFQAGNAQIALCGIDAAGVAITLTRASRMVFTDRDWTKAMNDQMEGRIRRIGQRHPQLFTILTAEGTVEDRIERSVQIKTMFEDAYVNQAGKFTKAQVREFLLGR